MINQVSIKKLSVCGENNKNVSIFWHIFLTTTKEPLEAKDAGQLFNKPKACIEVMLP